MSTRTALLLGLVGLGVVTGAILWFTQVKSHETVMTPGAAPGTADPSRAVALSQDHELTEPPRNQPPAPGSEAQRAGNGSRPTAERKAVEQMPVAPPKVAGAGSLDPAVQAPVSPEAEPLKLPLLDPIMGGTVVIKGKYAGSTYEERRTRADMIEASLAAHGDGGKNDPEIYQALKDELVWLRENMGTPPPAPK